MTITTTPEQTTTVSTGTATLVGAVKDALRAAPRNKRVLPILACVRVHADHGFIVVSGFDYEVSVTRTVPASGSIDAFIVPGIALRDALARLDQKKEVSISSADNRVTLAQGTRIVTLNTAAIEDYPLLPQVPQKPVAIETTGATLSVIATSLAPFVGKDDMLPVLSAVNLRLEDSTLIGGATDRFRAALIERPVAAHVEEFDVLVPYLSMVAAVMGKDEQVSVHLHEGTVTFSSEETVITQRVLDGQFPKLAALFSKDPVTVTTFEPVGFLSAVKFVEAGCERNTALAVNVSAGKVHLESTGDEGNSHADTVPAVVVGDDLSTGFNPAYLADAVKVFGKGHDVSMSSTVGTKPSLFESESIPNLRVLLMPRRLIS